MFTRKRINGGYALRFAFPRGVVWATVFPNGDRAELRVHEHEAVMDASARNLSDEDFASSPLALRARNRFGVAAMKAMLREVRAEFPAVREWHWERKTGAAIGRRGWMAS